MISRTLQSLIARRSRPLGAAVLCLALLPMPRTATAGETGDGGWTLAVGPTTGGLAFDPDLDNYRWDIRPAWQSGLEGTIYHDRFSAGLRVWRTHTTQGTGIPGETESPQVNMTGIDVTGGLRGARLAGVEVWALAHTGILHLGYDPDRVTVDTGGAGGQITVEYKPITEWEFGGGIGLRRELTPFMALAVQADTSTFALDTAHRRGSEIVEERERFFSWSLRFQLSWLFAVG